MKIIRQISNINQIYKLLHYNSYFLYSSAIMDYQNLYELVPKKTQQWSMQQISKWLQFINLPQLITSFRQAGIDGSCIHCIDDQTLKNQLNIHSTIIRKKLNNWISFGLQSYDKYISSTANSKNIMLQQIPLKKSITTCARNQSKQKLSSHNQISNFTQMSNELNNNNTYMILQQVEGNGVSYNIIRNQILSIGFGKSNNIVSLETSISEKHAILGYKNGGYFIQDLGSKFGTYMKINHRILLKLGMILEIGSYQFMVVAIQCNMKTLKLKQTYFSNDQDSQSENNKNQINKQNQGKNGRNKLNKSNNNKSNKNQPKMQDVFLSINLNQKSKFTFGRRKENDFQKQDKHMSSMHCKITFFNGNFYIQDYGSTNGTWIRISSQYHISPEVPIETDTIIKIGTAISYICKINVQNKNKRKMSLQNKYLGQQMVDQNLCKFCKKSENNCLFYPCSHNICCIQCSNNIGNSCPECSHQIGEKIKIHK